MERRHRIALKNPKFSQEKAMELEKDLLRREEGVGEEVKVYPYMLTHTCLAFLHTHWLITSPTRNSPLTKFVTD